MIYGQVVCGHTIDKTEMYKMMYGQVVCGHTIDKTEMYKMLYGQVVCGHTIDKTEMYKTRGSKMPQKVGCAGSNKVSDCCN